MVHRNAVAAGGALSLLVAGLFAQRARRTRSPEPAVASAAETASTDAATPKRPPGGKVTAGAPSMLHLDPHHTNRSPFAGPTSPNVAWTFDTGGPIEAAPAVLENGTIVVASLGGNLYALGDSGELRYKVDLGDRVYGAPLVQNDSLFVGSDAKKFFGLSSDGTIRFRLDADADVDTGAAPTP